MERRALADLLRTSVVALCLVLLGQVTQAAAGSVRLQWDPNAEEDIAGYVLAWGNASGTYTQSATLPPTAVMHEVSGIDHGTWYFAVRAFNSAGMHSGYSNEVQVVIESSVLPAPTITALSPASGPTTGGTDVVISGTGFQPGVTVTFASNAGVVLSQSPTSLTVRTPARAAGAVSVTVTNPDGGSAWKATAFTYQTQVSSPTVTAMSPVSGPAAGGTTVTLTGTSFKSGAVVRFGTLSGQVTSLTSTRIVVRSPARDAGAVPVTVLNPDGGSTQAPQPFTYTAPPATPTISSFAPASGPATGGTDVTITGTNFQSGAVVRFGAVGATVTSVTPTRITVRTPAQGKGIVALSVVNPSGNGAQVPSAFTYLGAAPTVTSVSPVVGPSAGGTDVTIEGANFENGVSVSINHQLAPVVSVTPSRLVVRMPAHAPATVGLAVTNPDSQVAWVPAAFTYENAGPAIISVEPASGPTGGGTTVTIVGSGFSAGASVRFDGVAATIVHATGEMLTVQTPGHAAGAVGISVVNADGHGTTRPAAYTYEDAAAPFVRYFAEGASGFFGTRFALANPHAEPVPVTVTFTDTRGVATPMEIVLPATTRFTIDESNRPPLASEAFATKFEAPRPIGVERTMTWAAGGAVYGAHSDTGVAAPRTSWVLAEGATIGGFETFYLLQNPSPTPAQIKVQYLLATGARIEKVHVVGPLSRTNIWVNKDDPALAAAEMSATITSLNGVPVVVERSMYRNTAGELFAAGHNSAAVAAPALRWFLAEGATGGTFDEFVLIANPNTTAAELKVSYLRAGQAPIVKSYVAAAQSRLTIWVDQEHAALANAEVSVVVESVTPTPVVVERSMWWRATAAGEWVESHNSSGVTGTAARWLVADGEAGGAGEASTYVLVANTAGAEAPVRFTVLTEQGHTRSVEDVVSANGRYSLDVAAAFPEVAQGRFSVLVEHTDGAASLVVERAAYSSTPSTAWAAGTNSLALPLPAAQ